MTLVAFLAGMSFVFALFALTVAIAEHLRAERVEKALLASLEKLNQAIGVQAETSALLTNQHATLESMIRAVAAASLPPSYPVGKVHIVVPGPGTLQ